MKKQVFKITTHGGASQTFYCDCRNRTLDSIVRYGSAVTVEVVQMTAKEYHRIAATATSAEFFND